jgi:Flp pilus assembly protein TadD
MTRMLFSVPLAARRSAGIAALTSLLALAACAGIGLPSATAEKPAVDPLDTSTSAAALAAEAGHDYKAAAASWGALYQRHPDNPHPALNLARNLRFSGEMQPAIDVCAGFVERHPASAPILAELGKDYLAADRLGLAVRTLRQAAKMAPKAWDIQSALGVALDYQGNYGEAQDAYRRALELSPNNPVVLNNLALSQAEAGQLKEAEKTLEQAVDQPRATVQVRQNLALIKALSGDLPAAERLARQDLPAETARANEAYYRLLSGATRVP